MALPPQRGRRWWPDRRNVRDYVLSVPVHARATAEAYLRVLDGRPSVFAPGERFRGAVARRAAGAPAGFHLALAGDAVFMEGHDAGISFLSPEEPGSAARAVLLS